MHQAEYLRRLSCRHISTRPLLSAVLSQNLDPDILVMQPTQN